jgi:hypothetical protein
MPFVRCPVQRGMALFDLHVNVGRCGGALDALSGLLSLVIGTSSAWPCTDAADGLPGAAMSGRMTGEDDAIALLVIVIPLLAFRLILL